MTPRSYPIVYPLLACYYLVCKTDLGRLWKALALILTAASLGLDFGLFSLKAPVLSIVLKLIVALWGTFFLLIAAGPPANRRPGWLLGRRSRG